MSTVRTRHLKDTKKPKSLKKTKSSKVTKSPKKIKSSKKGKGAKCKKPKDKKDKRKAKQKNRKIEQCIIPQNANELEAEFYLFGDGNTNLEELNTAYCHENSSRLRRLNTLIDEEIRILSVDVMSMVKLEEDCTEYCYFRADGTVYYTGGQDTENTIVDKYIAFMNEKAPDGLCVTTEDQLGADFFSQQETKSTEGGAQMKDNTIALTVAPVMLGLAAIAAIAFFMYRRREKSGGETRDSLSKLASTAQSPIISKSNPRMASSPSSKHINSILKYSDESDGTGGSSDSLQFPVKAYLIDDKADAQEESVLNAKIVTYSEGVEVSTRNLNAK